MRRLNKKKKYRGGRGMERVLWDSRLSSGGIMEQLEEMQKTKTGKNLAGQRLINISFSP